MMGDALVHVVARPSLGMILTVYELDMVLANER